MGYNSDFTHIPFVYDTPRQDWFWSASKETLQAIADIMQAHWRVEKKSITITYDMEAWFLVNDNLPCGITFGHTLNWFGGIIIYNFDTNDYYAPSGYAYNISITSLDVCMPNAQNVIIRCAYSGHWGYIDSVLSAMQNKDIEGQPFESFIITSKLYNMNYDARFRDEVAVSLSNPSKNMGTIRQNPKVKYSTIYNTNNLTRAMSTNVLYSDDAVYESNGTMYIASLDLEIINEPKSIMVDGIEYVGICFSLGYPSCYNYYFKVESED